MASPPTSLSFHGSHTPFLKHMFRLSSPPPPSSRPLCAVHSLQETETPSRSARLDVRLCQILKLFRYNTKLGHGWLEIHHVKEEEEEEELDAASQLLAESDVLSRRLPDSSIPSAAIVMKQYIVERRSRIPHTAMLIGLYKEADGKEAKPACVAEISFDAFGAHEASHGPPSPKDCPYICNVAVTKALRRRGIGSHLLRACEDLIVKMKEVKEEVYLHCRVANRGALTLYGKAGYKVVKKDSIFVWLSCRRRMYLMSKKLPPTSDGNPSDA